MANYIYEPVQRFVLPFFDVVPVNEWYQQLQLKVIDITESVEIIYKTRCRELRSTFFKNNKELFTKNIDTCIEELQSTITNLQKLKSEIENQKS